MLAGLGLAGGVAAWALTDGTVGTVTAAVSDRVITIPGTTNIVTYTIPTVTETVTVGEPPPPPPGYPPTGFSVHHFWIGTFSADAFNYPVDSLRVDDFIAHGADSWSAQGARFKQYQPNGHVLLYQDFGVAGDGITSVLTLAAARANGYLAHHNGAEIPNPWNGNASTPVMDLGKPGVADAYVAALRSKLAANPWDGIFADDVNAWYNLWPNQSIDGYSSPQDYWARAVLPTMQQVRVQLTAALVPNIGDWVNHTNLNDVLPSTSGAMNEFFLTYNNAATQLAGQIENEYASMQAATQAGKIYYGIVHRTDVQGLKFAFCAAAIMGGDHPELVRVANQQNYGSTAMTWDTSLTTQLGTPTSGVSHATGSASWSRSFSSGRTLSINTTTQTCGGL